MASSALKEPLSKKGHTPFLVKGEVKPVIILAIILATRLLGLFMIYPVFTPYAQTLPGATPVLVGLALGIYGLTQGALQIPLGALSDRWGRKAIIIAGLVLFGVGSVVAALSSSLWGIIIGRFIQGMGAIGSVVLALVADVTRDEARTYAMAIIGMTIGASFMVAIGIGPLLAAFIGVPGIFWLIALLALVDVILTMYALPASSRPTAAPARLLPSLARLGRNGNLLRLDYSIFTLHAVLTASFLIIPALLTEAFHLHPFQTEIFYLPTFGAALIFMGPLVVIAERKKRMGEVILFSLVLFFTSLALLLGAGTNKILIALALVLFFTVFTTMEALLPSLVTKTAPPEMRGTATGIYSSAQFLGIFFGGAFGGAAATWGGGHAVFILALSMAALWFLFAPRAVPRHSTAN